MRERQLGRNGPTVSAIGVGCAPMAGMYGTRAGEDGIAAIHRAIELGVTLFDTADIYGNGANEELVGRAIRDCRDEVVLATKFGGVMAGVTPSDDPRGLPKTSGLNGSPAYVHQACDASLRRLQIDTIDIYQMHRVDPDVPIEETVGALVELIEEGKIRYIGLCEARPSDIRRAAATYPVATLQSEYSLFERGIEDDVLPTCEELGIGLIPYAPLSRGLLSGSLVPGDELEAHDIRLSGLFPRVAPEHLAANAAVAQTVRDVAERHDATPAQVALAWLLGRSPTIVPIPGSDRVEYVEQNAAAPDLELTDGDLELLEMLASRVAGNRYSEQLAASASAVTAPLRR